MSCLFNNDISTIFLCREKMSTVNVWYKVGHIIILLFDSSSNKDTFVAEAEESESDLKANFNI